MPTSQKHSGKPKHPGAGVDCDAIIGFLDQELRINEIRDSSCNGLQVQGLSPVRKIALAVDACIEAYEMASKQNCQMILVHHGLFWENVRSITGPMYDNVKYLIDRGMSLYAAHLPLDCHPVHGNNAQLAKLLGLQSVKPFGMYHGTEIGFEGVLKKPLGVMQLSSHLGEALGTTCTLLPFGPERIKRVAVVSGGAGRELGEAIEKRADCYVTGETDHGNYHAAREGKINVIYCGHYHSETLGVKALGALLSKRFGIESTFINLPTPI